MQNTESRSIPGYPGYLATSDGKILTKSGQEMKASPDRDGYFRLTLSVNGKAVKRYVHQLVAAAFVGEALIGQEVRHKNGICTDNRSDNLLWGTRRENMNDRRAHGHNPIGSRNGRALLLEAQVMDIRRQIASGAKRSMLATEYGVTIECINDIAQRRNWNHLPAEAIVQNEAP